MRNLNDIIRRVISEQFFSLINEQDEPLTKPADESNVNDFIVEITSTGGGMMLPKSANPEILERVDKSLFKSKLDTTEKILEYVKNKPYVSLICQKYHDDVEFNSCASLYVQTLFNKWVDGGVKKFSATLPGRNEKTVFNACWRITDGSNYVDFKDIRLAGYYPSSDGSGNCTGNPWAEEIKNIKSEGGQVDDFQSKISFQIKLQMIK
jgi:hypothetical protein